MRDGPAERGCRAIQSCRCGLAAIVRMPIAYERLDNEAGAKLRCLLDAGDPRGQVRMAWHSREVVRSIYEITDPELVVEYVAQLGNDRQDESCPPELQRYERTITRWRDQISVWHRARFTNMPTEALNNLGKRVKRVAFGITTFGVSSRRAASSRDGRHRAALGCSSWVQIRRAG